MQNLALARVFRQLLYNVPMFCYFTYRYGQIYFYSTTQHTITIYFYVVFAEVQLGNLVQNAEHWNNRQKHPQNPRRSYILSLPSTQNITEQCRTIAGTTTNSAPKTQKSPEIRTHKKQQNNCRNNNCQNNNTKYRWKKQVSSEQRAGK